MSKGFTAEEVIEMITPYGHSIYHMVDPLDSDSVVPKWSRVDDIELAFKQIAGEHPKNWGPYIFALETVIRQHEMDTSFLMYWLQHAINIAMRSYLPNGDGVYVNSYGPVYNSQVFSLGSLSAVVSYFTGTTEPSPHFQVFFADLSNETKIHSFKDASNKVMQDLTDFYNMPSMPNHLKHWLSNYIRNVKAVLYYRAFDILEADQTPVPVL